MVFLSLATICSKLWLQIVACDVRILGQVRFALLLRIVCNFVQPKRQRLLVCHPHLVLKEDIFMLSFKLLLLLRPDGSWWLICFCVGAIGFVFAGVAGVVVHIRCLSCFAIISLLCREEVDVVFDGVLRHLQLLVSGWLQIFDMHLLVIQLLRQDLSVPKTWWIWRCVWSTNPIGQLLEVKDLRCLFPLRSLHFLPYLALVSCLGASSKPLGIWRIIFIVRLPRTVAQGLRRSPSVSLLLPEISRHLLPWPAPFLLFSSLLIGLLIEGFYICVVHCLILFIIVFKL